MEEPLATPPATQPTHAPTMDVIAPPPAAVKPAPHEDATHSKDKPAPAKEAKAKKPAAPKQPGNGVGMAIFATVVIVLALAAMATFAYIKTQN